MHWIKIKNWVAEKWAVIIILLLLIFIAYELNIGNLQVSHNPELGVYLLYDESYGEDECYITARGHITNYGNAIALSAKAVCRVDNSVETIKYWEHDAGDISPKSQEWFVERIDIPCSKVELVSCAAECINC